jgi:hypothetical protein
MFGALPVVDLFLHPGSILLLTLKVTLPATEAEALISFAWRKTSALSAIVIVALVDPAVKVIVV